MLKTKVKHLSCPHPTYKTGSSKVHNPRNTHKKHPIIASSFATTTSSLHHRPIKHKKNVFSKRTEILNKTQAKTTNHTPLQQPQIAEFSSIKHSLLDEHIPDRVLFPLPESYLNYCHDDNNAAINNPTEYWLSRAHELLDWHTKPTVGLNTAKLPFHHWFEDGKINLCYNAVDTHIKSGLGEKDAFIFESVYSNTTEHISYNEVARRVNILCNAFKKHGLTAGDRIMLYMPMIPEAAIMLLACHRLGLITSNTYGGFSSHELMKRINAFEPKFIFSASCGLEPNKIIDYQALVNGALHDKDLTHTLQGVVYVDRPAHLQLNRAEMKPHFDHEFNEFVNIKKSSTGELVPDETFVDAVPLPSNHTSYVAYTSGTTSTPKGLLRDTGGIALMLKNSIQTTYGVPPGKSFFCSSDFGWVAGLSFALYGPLLNAGTSLIFEGKPTYPDASTYWRLVAKHNIKASFLAPTAIRAMKQLDPTLSLAQEFKQTLHDNDFTLFLAGEKSNRAELHWLQNHLDIPCIDHFWASETGAPTTVMPRSIRFPQHVKTAMDNFDVNPHCVRFGASGLPVNGYNFRVMDDAGKLITTPEQEGNLVLKLPLPPGFMTDLFKDPGNKRYMKYFDKYEGYFDLSDSGYIDKDGVVSVLGRSDDVFNTAGHRLSSSMIEEVTATHNSIADCCVIPIPDNLKGQVPVVFAVIKNNNTLSQDTIERDIIKRIRETVGPIATPKNVLFVEKLPKTRSGKILRGTMKQMINYLIYTEQHRAKNVHGHHEQQPPSSLDAPEVSEFYQQFDPHRDIYNKMVPFPTTIDDASALTVIETACKHFNIIKDSLDVEEIEKIK